MRLGSRELRVDGGSAKSMSGSWRLECTHWAPPSWFEHSNPVRHQMLVFCQKCGDLRRVAARSPWPA